MGDEFLHLHLDAAPRPELKCCAEPCSERVFLGALWEASSHSLAHPLRAHQEEENKPPIPSPGAGKELCARAGGTPGRPHGIRAARTEASRPAAAA